MTNISKLWGNREAISIVKDHSDEAEAYEKLDAAFGELPYGSSEEYFKAHCKQYDLRIARLNQLATAKQKRNVKNNPKSNGKKKSPSTAY